MLEKYLLRSSFLDSEIEKLLGSIPSPLIGTEPICLCVFQPTESGGDLILLDADQKNLVRMKPGWGEHQSFIDRGVGVTWGAITKTDVKAKMIKHYVEKNDDDVKRAIGTIYKNRFHGKIAVLEDGHVPAGTPYELIFVCPGPDYANTSDYRRVPRLGLMYSFAGLQSDIPLIRKMGTAADKILRARLTTLLEYQGNFSPKPERLAAGKKGRSALEIARAVATNSQTTMDERIFVAAKASLLHHFFFPHDPVAVHLFHKLQEHASDVTALFNRHGLEQFKPAQETDMQLDDLINALTGDIAYLIAACDHNTMNSHAVKTRDRIVKKMEQPVRIALALLCGIYIRQSNPNADHVTIQPPQNLTADISELPWPVFRFNQFSTWASSPKAEDAARSFLESLHPEGPLSSRTAERYNNTHIAVEKSENEWSVEKHDTWYISYARARCTFDFLMNQKERAEK